MHHSRKKDESIAPRNILEMTEDSFVWEWRRIWVVPISWSRTVSQNPPKKDGFSQNFDIKPSLEFDQGWEYSRTLSHSQMNRLTNDFVPLNPSLIFSLFRKWCTSSSKVPKITAYVISCDVIGHEARLDSDISLETYGLKLWVFQVVSLKNNSF